MRVFRRAFSLVVVGALLAGGTPPAAAVTVDVSMVDDAYVPTSIKVGLGTSVRWTNNGAHNHTVQSDESFFGSLTITPGNEWTLPFTSAGRFKYHCLVHGVGMNGVVNVKMQKSGTPDTGWTVTWSSLAKTPANRQFDVQIKRPGDDHFSAFRTDTVTRKASFNPSRNGTYVFRARTDQVSVDKSSGWSPKLSLLIS